MKTCRECGRKLHANSKRLDCWRCCNRYAAIAGVIHNGKNERAVAPIRRLVELRRKVEAGEQLFNGPRGRVVT